MPEDQRESSAGGVMPRSPAASGGMGVLATLLTGEMEIEGRMPWSSNGTYLARVGGPVDGGGLRAIYKPHRGERPLWDFPEGLFKREVAAYELSAALGWDLVPETVLRLDGPLGPGSLQRFVEADFEQHYFTLLEDETLHPQLLRMAVWDLVANNADRKGGHVLIDSVSIDPGHLWGIDHGLCFHIQPKLRTVIWDFGGEPIPDDLRTDLLALAACVPRPLSTLLSDEEVAVLARRATVVARLPALPDPEEDRRPYPWPLV